MCVCVCIVASTMMILRIVVHIRLSIISTVISIINIYAYIIVHESLLCSAIISLPHSHSRLEVPGPADPISGLFLARDRSTPPR